MSISVAEVLLLPPFENANVIAGKKGLSRIIKGVTVVDTPDVGQWLKGGELLLTTAYVIKEQPEKLNQLIKDVHCKQAAAIAIKLKRFINNVPKSVIALADELNLPLIEIPFQISWIDIISPVTSEIVKRQMTLYAEDTNEIQQKLLQNLFSGGDINSVIYLLADLIQKPCAYYDAAGNLLAFKNGGSIVKNPDDTSLYCIKSNLREEEYLSFPIKVGRRIHGHLVISAKWDSLSQLHRFVINQVVVIVALEIYRLLSIQKAEQHLRDDFLYELITGKITSMEDAVEKAQLYKLNVEGSKAIMVIDAYRQDIKTKISDIKNSIINYSKSISLYIIVTRIEKLLVFIVDTKNNTISDADLICLAENLKKNITSLKELSIGIGRRCDNPLELVKSYLEAKSALELGRIISKHGIFHYKDLGFYRLLTNCMNDHELQNFYLQTLGNLEKTDAELINTLECFLQTNGNTSETANKMYLHYNTIKYRLNQIEKLLNINLKEPEVRFNLMVGLKIRNYLSRHLNNTSIEN
ncbi:MAG: PucR family transcriptional regulator ligand-binding domain-containing protein [Bacillota bacterium]